MGALPLADVTVYYIDMRAVGKGYDEFYEQAGAMGAELRQGPRRRHQREGGRQPDPPLRGHRERRRIAEAEYDLVVLAVGVQPNLRRRARSSPTASSPSTTTTTSTSPTRTSIPAARASPACSSPARPPAPRTSPIPSCTPARRSRRPRPTWKRSEGAAYERARESASTSASAAATSPTTSTSTRSSHAVEDEPDVVVARRPCSPAPTRPSRRSCRTSRSRSSTASSSPPARPSCTPSPSASVAKRAGMNPYQYTQVNIREQCSWTHTDDRRARHARRCVWCAPASPARGSP